jgi:hypothetical protein
MFQQGNDNPKNKMLIIRCDILIYLSIVWPIIIIFTCIVLYFTLHLRFDNELGGINQQVPTISITGSLYPASIIFTYGLHVEALFLSLLFFNLYFYYERILSTREENDDERSSMKPIGLGNISYFCCGMCMTQSRRNNYYYSYWNQILLCIGLVASFFMSLVGSISLFVSVELHSFFALWMYALAVVHLLVHHYTLADISDQTFTQKQLRFGCIFVTIPLNIFIFIIGLIVIGACDDESV